MDRIVEFTIPENAKVLSVGTQHGLGAFWVMFDPNKPKKPFKYTVIPTGGKVPPNMEYKGTFQLDAGKFIGHLFTSRG